MIKLLCDITQKQKKINSQKPKFKVESNQKNVCRNTVKPRRLLRNKSFLAM